MAKRVDELISSEIYEIDMKDWITKSNTIIESRYKLSLQEQRILLITASKVQPSDEDFKQYKFRVRDLIDRIGAGNQTSMYTYIKEVIKGLQSKTIEYKKGNRTYVANWLVTSIYEETEGTIILKLNPDLKEFFLQLKERFTTYQLENVIQLNSVYSIRIYELLKQYESIKKRNFPLEELREKLGIEKTKYKQYGHFKKRVLTVAQEEVAEKTDIQFTFEEVKQGRKVVGIVFQIKGKVGNAASNQAVIEKEEDKPGQLDFGQDFEKEELRHRLKQLKVGASKVQYLFDHYPLDQIKRNVEYCENNAGRVKSIGGYTYKAITTDYALSEVELPSPVHSDDPEDKTILFHLSGYWRKSNEQLPYWFVDEKSIEEIQKQLNVDSEHAQEKYLQIKGELYKALDIQAPHRNVETPDESAKKRKELEERLSKYK
ncbi:replication initiation protein [Bacillus dakarensis]|uniref:replication initiation protein n=1 Tax=Robertmurraya dakarensis TaxID=1926278 RepID=UPI000981E7FD|nr:replication initiation protein [Bacillus dakarensis]